MQVEVAVSAPKKHATADDLRSDNSCFNHGHATIIGARTRFVQPSSRQGAILSGHAQTRSLSSSDRRPLRPLVRTVDRLQRLATFEAAARLGSFSAAGRELGLAQPAVTRQVQALEHALGVGLFDRHANRIALTEAGHVLADSLDVTFGAIEHTLGEIARIDDTFVLAMPPGFAQLLVVPRLDELQLALGDRDLRLWLYDRQAELSSSSFDAAVRVGTGAWPGLDSHYLIPEVVMPVAAPSVAEEWALHADSSAADVLVAPLLHMDGTDRPWLSWSEWLAAFDLALTPGRRRVVFNNYPAILQHVIAGKGVALAWAGLTDGLVADEVLTVVGPAVSSQRAYYLTWKSGRRTAGVESVINWLHETVNPAS